MLGPLVRRARLAANMSQESLAKGICTPSYLSKIENGQAQCSDEMIRLLFAALDIWYTTEPRQLEAFDRCHARALALLRRVMPLDALLAEEGEQALFALCEALRYSPRGIDAALLEALLRLYRDWPVEREALSFFVPFMHREQRLLYASIDSVLLAQAGQFAQAIDALDVVRSPQEPWIYAEMASQLFAAGQYERTVEIAQQGYSAFAEQGYARGMMLCAVWIGNAHANGQQHSGMEKWYTVAARLNEVVCDAEIEGSLVYNRGSTMLMDGLYAKAMPLLEKSLGMAQAHSRDPAMAMLSLQKLAFAHAAQGDAAKTMAGIERLGRDTPQDEAFAALVRYMATTPDYAARREYCERLEACVETTRAILPRGRMEFFATFLLRAYEATGQYKKALRFVQKYKLSHLLR